MNISLLVAGWQLNLPAFHQWLSSDISPTSEPSLSDLIRPFHIDIAQIKHGIYVTFSGDNMGLDQSREKLYRVRDNVQDFKGMAFSFYSIPWTFRDSSLTLDTPKEYKVEQIIWGMYWYDSFIQYICMRSSAVSQRRSRLLVFILCRLEVTLNLILRSAVHYVQSHYSNLNSYRFTYAVIQYVAWPYFAIKLSHLGYIKLWGDTLE